MGHPIAHSLSPVLHAAAHAALGLDDWRYSAVDVTDRQLPAVMAALGPEWGGLSLTMPLKHAVIPLLCDLSPLAAAVGAVNTVLPAPGPRPDPGEPGRWRGENTDVHGVVAALREALDGSMTRDGDAVVAPPRTAAVLGGGATAAAALAALRELGVAVPVVHVRSPLRAAAVADVADRLGMEVDVAPWERAHRATAADVVVSTVPAGGADALAASLGRPGMGPGGPGGGGRGAGRGLGVLLDVVYDPWPTALATAWAARGGTVVGGATMLLHQAGEQVRLMTGRPAPLDAMRAALVEMLARRPWPDARLW